MIKPMRPRIRPKSKAKSALDRDDQKLRYEWWQQPGNQSCCVCGVKLTPFNRERHHSRGRTRKLQNDTRWWLPLCSKCHLLVKLEPTWAMAYVVFPGTPRAQYLLASGRDWMTSGPLLNSPPVPVTGSVSGVDQSPHTTTAQDGAVAPEAGGIPSTQLP